MNRFPSRRFYGEAMQSQMFQVIHGAQQRVKLLDDAGYTGRRVMGFKIPDWQRQQKWTQEQCVAFIESIWLGANIGAYMVNQPGQSDDLYDVLLDGQQRLIAVEKYLAGAFPVPGDDGNSYYWHQMVEEERAHFYRIPFPWIRTQYETEELAKAAYNRHNFGGTPHLESERA